MVDMVTEYLEIVPQSLWIAWVFILGLMVGSFLNVCIFRWVKEEDQLSIVTPRSFCPSCKTTIHWYDNVPLLSYILLRAKCRSCGWRIPFHYPVVELLGGLILLGFFMRHGFSASFVFSAVFVCMLLIATVTDFQIRIIPDEVSFYGIFFALLMSFTFPHLQGETGHRIAIGDSILGVLLGGGVLYLIAIVGDLVARQESMGGGDIKLLAMIGAFLGPWNVMAALVYGACLGAVIGIIILITKKDRTIAFGPYLALGGVVSLLWGLRPFETYMSFLWKFFGVGA